VAQTAYTAFFGNRHMTRSFTQRKSRDWFTKIKKPITLMCSKTFNSILANLKKKFRKKRQRVYKLTIREVRNWYGGDWQ